MDISANIFEDFRRLVEESKKLTGKRHTKICVEMPGEECEYFQRVVGEVFHHGLHKPIQNAVLG